MKGFLVVWSGVCAALVATPLAAEPPADSEIDAIRQEIFLEGIRDCKPAAMSRCWYIFFGGDQAPGRRLWLLDLKDQSGDRTKGLVYTDVLIIDESTETRPLGAQGVFDFVLQSFEVDCRKRRMRMRPESFALGFEGQSAYAGQYGAWSDHKGRWRMTWRGSAITFARWMRSTLCVASCGNSNPVDQVASASSACLTRAADKRVGDQLCALCFQFGASVPKSRAFAATSLRLFTPKMRSRAET